VSAYRNGNTHYSPVNYETRDEWESYANWLKRHVAVSFALEPEPPRPPLKPEVFGKWNGNGYTCEKVYFESLPGFFATGNLFRPSENPANKHPGILCPHGHWPDGRLHDRDVRGSIIARCIQFARMGAVVFSYDTIGNNDSCQLSHRQFEGDEHYGMSLMALQTWNSIRSVDFISELPDVDDTRIGVTGTSGGGTQTFALTAVDRRITVAAPICMISYQMQGGCLCENAPLLRIDATSVDIARLFAPKPMFMGSCTGDWTKDTAEEELPAIKNIYRVYGGEESLMHHHIDFEHNYNQEMREHVYGFFNKYLFGKSSGDPIEETEIGRPPHRDRLVWWGRKAPEEISQTELQQIWRDRAESILLPYLKSPESVRTGLGDLLPHSLGVTLDSVEQFAGKDPQSIDVNRSGNELTIAEKRPLSYPEEQIRYFSAYNRTPFADRVHEILGILQKMDDGVKLIGLQAAGPAVLAVAALSDKVAEVEADMNGFDASKDEDWQRHLDTPSIRQIGGLATIFARIGRRPLVIRNASDSAIELKEKYAH
jgi:hypothetical protein